MSAAIICIARNEAPYTAEWLEYHFGLGFDRIYYISTDEDSSPIKALVEKSGFMSRVHFFHIADWEPISGYLPGTGLLQFRIFQRDQGSGMSHGQLLLGDHFLDLFRKFEQADVIGHRGPVFSDFFRHLLLGQSQIVVFIENEIGIV